ncbi:MAG: ClbS/DfsB family four-helix bundle protein [Acidimicrobiales bacterium]
MDREELLRTITTAHRELAEIVERISDVRLRDQAMDAWKGKDVLAHLAWWQDHSAQVIEALRANRPPDDETDSASTTDDINERVLREHVDDPPDVAREAFTQSFERLLAAMEPLTDDELFSADQWPWLAGQALVEMLLWDTSRHYVAHLGHLEPLLQNAET